MVKNIRFSQKFNLFHEKTLPEPEMKLAGYAALINIHNLKVPLPLELSAISEKNRKYSKDGWNVFTPRHQPEDSLVGHLTFALKHEGVDLAVLKALFDKIEMDEIVNLVKSEPTGIYSRRIWFFYEWLQNKTLNLPDAVKGNIVDTLNTDLQYAGPSRYEKRYRIRNNLPGVPDYCPLIRKTLKLDELIQLNLSDKSRTSLQAVSSDLLKRAVAFILLKDSKASYAIEGESPPQSRAERWGNAIGNAGTKPLSHEEFLRLQEIVIADFRFIHYGYRTQGGFIGEHERSTGFPLPEHISARSEDLFKLMDGLIATNQLLKESDYNPILAAAAIAFGFVFIHPFEDGNGRVHRYLIHHVLAEKKFINITLPISAIILDRIEEYKAVLELFSLPRLPLINWRPTIKGNIEVLNETIDLYRYFDATKQAEFLFGCVKETIETALPEELDYLKKYDEMKLFIKNYIDMPDRLIDLLIRFLSQNEGIFSKRAKQKEFNSLTAKEIEALEEKYKEIFNQFSS